MMKIRFILIMALFFIASGNTPGQAQVPGCWLNFDTPGDGVRIPDINSQLDNLTTQLTIEAWIFPKSFSTNAFPRIVDRSDNFTDDRFVFALDDITGGLNFNINGNRAIGDTVFLNQWNHISGTYDGSSIKIYLNGILSDSLSATTIIDVRESDLFIGRDSRNFRPFDGYIDEVRVWNVARSASQIAATMNDTLGQAYYANADSGLVGYWRFDELRNLGINNDGLDDVSDLSAEQNHGDLIGSPLLTCNENSLYATYQPQRSDIVLCDQFAPERHLYFDLSEFSNITQASLTFGYFNFDYIVNQYPENISREHVDYQITIDGALILSENNITDSTTVRREVDILNQVIGKDTVAIVFKNWGGGDGIAFVQPHLLIVDSSLVTQIVRPVHIPKTLFLSQNYPNPFNPGTAIKYRVPESGQVKLIIYNTLGQKVKTLVNEKLNSGNYEITWDGLNNQGYRVASGTYFYQLQMDDQAISKRMILLK